MAPLSLIPQGIIQRKCSKLVFTLKAKPHSYPALNQPIAVILPHQHKPRYELIAKGFDLIVLCQQINKTCSRLYKVVDITAVKVNKHIVTIVLGQIGYLALIGGELRFDVLPAIVGA